MLQTNLLNPGHADLVTHVVYDFYGERLATCSADQKIKIFRKNAEDAWEPEAEWKAHDAPLLRLAFAHPLHGSLIASCSHDRTVRVWEEPSASTSGGNAGNRDGRWIEKGILTGAKGSVRSVEFAPPSPAFGLRVASISTDSHLRIHSSLDPNLNDWSLSNSVYIPSLVPAGSSEAANAEAATISPTTTDELAIGGWGLSWCKERWWGSVLAVFAGTSPIVKIITLNPSPTSLIHLTPPSSSPLTSMSWAPSCGRSYHLIATGARDGTVRIWRVEPPSDGEDQEDTKEGWKAEVVAEFEKGGARVGMVDWNATGTTLTTSDDEGVIRIYKPTYAKSWKLFGKMTAEEPEEANGQ